MRTKLAALLCLMFSLTRVYTSNAQTSYGIISAIAIMPANNAYGTPIASIGASVGIGGIFDHSHWGLEYTAFGDDLNSRYNYAPNREFQATTAIVGLAATPTYCFDPKNKFVKISGGLSVKAGYNWGIEDVIIPGTNGAKDETLEHKTAAGDVNIALAPKIMIAFKTANDNQLGLEFGYDASGFGTGASRIRSAYYTPPGYNSGFLYAGIIFRITN